MSIYTEEARRLALCLIKDRPMGMSLAEAGRVILDGLNAAMGEASKAREAMPNIPGLAADPSAFVRWAEPKGYNLTSHPLHFLFLNEKTYAAREGWNACKQHYGIDA